MQHPYPRIHGGLTPILTLTKDGNPRTNLPPVAMLPAADLAAITKVRARMLECERISKATPPSKPV